MSIAMFFFFLVSSSIIGVIAQRLMRKICPECIENYDVPLEILATLNLHNIKSAFSRGKGCPQCLKSGYKGRMGLYELMLPSPEVRRKIITNSSSNDIRLEAQKNGMRTLQEIGIEKMLQGLTTPEEILRITQETEE